MTPEQVATNKENFINTMNNMPGIKAWDSISARIHLRDVWVEWISNLCDWRIFLTLTFRDDKPVDSAMKYWLKLVRVLNSDVVDSKHYTRIVGHSYFSYALGIHYQKRGVIHFHVLVDKPLNFKLIHSCWGSWCGFAKCEFIKNKSQCVEYITSYILKDDGVVDPYVAKKDFKPRYVPPYWWNFDLPMENILLRS
jgi:hypothetical protein